MFSNHQHKIAALVCVALLFPVTVLSAQENDAHGLMTKVFNKNIWRDFQGEIALTLTNPRGKQKVRSLRVYSKHSKTHQMRMLMRFLNPADVRGTGLLVIEHEDSEDDRRLYLPSLRRIHRISASGVGGNFMASDFSYYDLGRPKLDDWRYQYSNESDKKACVVIIGTAENEEVQRDTGYSKVEWCVDKARQVVLHADYYDTHGDLLKRLAAVEIKLIDGVHFMTHARMTDARNKHQSDMEFSSLEVNQGIDDAIFTERFLRKWRR